MRRTTTSLCLSLLLLLGSTRAFAGAPAIPSSPPLKAAEIVKLLDGHTFSFTAYDFPVTGTSVWNIQTKSVSGDYVFAGLKKGTYKIEWTIEGDKSCTKTPGKDRTCETIYKYGKGFMEVTEDGKVRAVSTPK
ncbi:MAG: hypothetical protein ABWY00_04220 [Dongiaceae bacterium]